MLNKLFKGIFGHFLMRSSAIGALSGLLLLAFVLKFFDYTANDLAAEQGKTFANSTMAASSDALFAEDYPAIVEYSLNVMKVTPNIISIVYSKRNGEELIITDRQWGIKRQTLPYYQYNFKELPKSGGAGRFKMEYKGFGLGFTDSFIYSKPIYISGKDWGVLTITFSTAAYSTSIRSFYEVVIIFTFASILISFFLFWLSSKRIRKQINSFSAVAKTLSDGNLEVKAQEAAIGEIGVLGQAINSMSSALIEKSARLNQLAEIVEQTNDVFVLFDSSLNVIFVNNAMTELTGYSSSDFMGMSMLDFTGKLNLNYIDLLQELELMEAAEQHIPVRDIVVLNKNKIPIDVEMRLETISNNQAESSYLMVLSNIAMRKKLENELHQLAYYDKLTDLPNRRMFMDCLRKTVASCQRNKKSFALFFMDLDNFKYINDSLGHDAGDEFLVQVGNRLRDIFRSNDMVTRLGGDEFTIIIEDIKDSGYLEIGYLAEKLVTDLASKPIFINGRPLSISTSLGVAKYPDNGADSNTLLRNADTAMYAAKKSGKNRYTLFSEEMNVSLRFRIEMERDLKQAIQLEGQVTLYYQPIVDLITQELVGVEALARWIHPDRGFIPPDEFIKIAENSNLIIALSEYLLSIAFKQAKVWEKEQFTPYVSVNISGRHFEQPNFMESLVFLLNTYNVAANKIQLEFTESIMLDSTEETIEKFEKLKNIGFKIAIDDFGTGYSSLGYIHQLPIDVIKIDKSFIMSMLDNNKTNAIVTAITTLSTTLGIKTIAEGVELEVHVDKLRKYHCDYGQGYLYDKALPIAEFERKYRYAAQQTITLDMEQYIKQIVH